MKFVRRRSTLFLVAAAALLVGGCSKQSGDVTSPPSPNRDSESINRADRLAAHPADPSKPKDVAGVSDEQFQSGDAIEQAATACMDAVEKNPDEPRSHFELGRVLVLGGLIDEGREELQAATDKGHGGAYFYLAQIEENLDNVNDLLQKASAAGFKPADEMLAQLETSEPAKEASEEPPVESSPHNGLPLRDEQITNLQWSMLGPISEVPMELRDLVASQIEQIIHSGQKVLVCSYGTSETDKKTYHFWYQNAPPNLETLIKGVEKHPLRSLGSNACTTAPDYSEEAQRMHDRTK